MEREKKIIKVSIQGIIVNLVLVTFKAIIGVIVNSIAIVLDAINNLSDALSSIIAIIGTKLSSKKPDKKHPYGHGRIEYFTSIIIATIVLIAGWTALIESVKKIMNPEMANYSIESVIIIIIAVFVKLFFGRYTKKQGEILNSSNLIASGTDAICDSILSFSTFIAAIISIVWKISLEGYIGVVISIFIFKSVIDILRKTIDDMIGVRADSKLTQDLRKKIEEYDEVLGVCDIIMHNYGPNKIIASARIEVEDSLSIRELNRITRRIASEVFKEFGIIITIGIYASNNPEEYKEVKNYILEIIKKYKNIIQLHGFYVDEEYKTISFDLIFNFDELNPEEKVKEITEKMKEKYPQYELNIIIDTDLSD